MADNRKTVKHLCCPMCFIKETDTALRYDERDEEYYCPKCCYEGTEEEITNFLAIYSRTKYKQKDART